MALVPYALAFFAASAALPTLDFDDPDLRLVDLTGDGLTDALLTGDDGLTWHPSLGVDGFGPARHLAAAPDEERGPRLLSSD